MDIFILISTVPFPPRLQRRCCNLHSAAARVGFTVQGIGGSSLKMPFFSMRVVFLFPGRRPGPCPWTTLLDIARPGGGQVGHPDVLGVAGRGEMAVRLGAALYFGFGVDWCAMACLRHAMGGAAIG